MTWIAIGSTIDIPLRGARVIAMPQRRIAVFRTIDDRFFAIEDRCPHKAGPLSQGIVHGAAVTCPLHNWVVSLKTGEALGADEGSVRRFALKVEDKNLFISLEEIPEGTA
ncbi:MAG: nitrite reductase small subunit NirD [Bradyrhizobiaceae bacterium]|nr:nitrite reductase small subunit NirD [Bradyrhizobiaceae bacterium]